MRRPNYSIDYAAEDEHSDERFYRSWWWWSESDDEHGRPIPHDGSGRVSALFWHRRHNGHGVGFQFGRNGDDSDVGLVLYFGKLGAIWTRYQSKRTARFRIPGDYDARHYGVIIRPHGMSWVTVEWAAREFGGESGRWTLNARTLLGPIKADHQVLETGETTVPMPEGEYAARWVRERCVRSYRRPLGRLRDRVFGKRTSESVNLDIPGGIPVEGKGENSWDVGMDGIFGVSGDSVPDAVGRAVSAALRDRERYGGPFWLPYPLSVSAAEKRSI